MIDQGAAVVGWNNANTRREGTAHFFKFLLHPVDHFERVLAIPHNHHAADHFPFSIQIRDAITQIRTEMNRGYVFDVDRSAVLRRQDHVLNVSDVLDIASATNKKFVRRNFKFLLYSVDHFERVLAIPHDHHAADHFPFSIQIRDAIAEVRTEMNRGYVFDVDGCAVLRR